jgi:hypothetical protein
MACTPLEFFEITKDYIDGTKNCDGVMYQTEYQGKSVYRDIEENIYEVLMDYESKEDFWTSKYTGKDIAQIASIAIDTLEQNNFTSSQDLYKYEFNKFHIIVISSEEEFAYLYNPDLYIKNKKEVLEKVNNILAFTNSQKFCWDENDVNFTIVIKTVALNPSIIIHELGHIISLYVYGNQDSDHSDKRIWYNDGKYNSINQKIIENYEKITGLSAFGDVYGKY